ncbi:ABC transporter ATP-binding protein [Mycoplasmatota bacterium WC44]
MSEIVLNTKDLTKVYSTFRGAAAVNALNGINLTVKKSDFIGIMGASGSGKTTLLNILSGVDTPTSGDIRINDKDITEMKKGELSLFRRENSGYVFQDFNLLDSLSVEENIGLPLILSKKNPDFIKGQSKKVMKFVGISDLNDKYPYNISGGQKQRVAIARAIINDPSIIYADEPTGNLDSKATKIIMDILCKMNDELKSTILMVTHDPYTASYCSKVIFIKDGNIESEITSEGNRDTFFHKIIELQSHIGSEE